VTRDGGPDFVPVEQRIAVFDNDGTLWPERPFYVQLAFALDRVKDLAPKHPEWRDNPSFKGVLEGDLQEVLAGGERALAELVVATHVGNTTEEFERIVKAWIASARHPAIGRRYTDLVYQPMLELLAFTRANGFKTFIVSGGGVEFLRPWVEEVYGVPPEQVVGSRVKVRYDLERDAPVLWRLADIDLVDDGVGKPAGIHQSIGRRPIAAFGNSDGDRQMLEWTTLGVGLRFGLVLHHTDAEREWSYDRLARVGRLSQVLDDAPGRGWVVVDMKRDWNRVFSFS
jgi:hypothetical protein